MFETSSESPAPVRVVTEAIKEYVDRLGAIWIEGEISEINERSGGMAFMRLRDTSVDMSISVMCHRSVLSSVSPLPQNARVVMYAKASWYTKNGSLSPKITTTTYLNTSFTMKLMTKSEWKGKVWLIIE